MPAIERLIGSCHTRSSRHDCPVLARVVIHWWTAPSSSHPRHLLKLSARASWGSRSPLSSIHNHWEKGDNANRRTLGFPSNGQASQDNRWRQMGDNGGGRSRMTNFRRTAVISGYPLNSWRVQERARYHLLLHRKSWQISSTVPKNQIGKNLITRTFLSIHVEEVLEIVLI